MRPIFTAPPAPGFPLLRLRPPHAPASTVVAPDMPTSRSTFLRSYVAISDYLSLDLLLGRQPPQHPDLQRSRGATIGPVARPKVTYGRQSARASPASRLMCGRACANPRTPG